MTSVQKTEIAELLEKYVASFDSQAKAVASLKDVSEATVIQMRKSNWGSISDAMWRSVAKQIGYQKKTSLVETMVFDTCILYYGLAKDEGATFALLGHSGCGKTHAGQWFSKSAKNAYYIECAGYWNKRYFLLEMIQAMGKDFTGNVYEMMEYIITELRRQDNPVFILDEIDKLAEPVLLFFITLYNKLNGLCGFVWQSTHAMQTVMNKRAKKIGYSELKTRISSFVELHKLSREEIKELCTAKGITSEEDIDKAYSECENGNIRRIDRLYIKHLAKARSKRA
jgi:DNA transposition AAA+ family ATPase